MKGPNRLLESSENELERLLLRAARERAPRGAKGRAIAAATGVFAASTLSAGSAVGGAAAGKVSATATTALLSLKWIVVVGVASVGLAAGAAGVRVVRAERADRRAKAAAVASGTAPSSGARASSSLASPEPARGEIAPPLATSAAVEPVPVDPRLRGQEPRPLGQEPVRSAASIPAPPTRGSTAAGGPPRATTGSPSATDSNPVAELAMLDQARGAIRDGEPSRGLTILDQYASRFPQAVMGPEASILRIEALVNTGDREAATRAGAAFLRANPASPYASRIESLLSASRP
jgi:hypothetical protein